MPFWELRGETCHLVNKRVRRRIDRVLFGEIEERERNVEQE